MVLQTFPSPHSITIQPNVRCLVGLYGSVQDPVFEDLNGLDSERDDDLLAYPTFNEELDEVRFLVGSQSLKSNGNQVTLVTLSDSLDLSIKKQIFSHTDGEILGLSVFAAQPDWFVSVFSNYSSINNELRTGARVWHLPNLHPSDGTITTNTIRSGESVTGNQTTLLNSLDYVTTLPLENYSIIRKITSHPSNTCVDLACVVGPPSDSIGSGQNLSNSLNTTSTNHLVLLTCPTKLNASDYQLCASAKLIHPNGGTPINSIVNSVKWSPHDQCGQIALAMDSGVLGVDVRSMKACFWLRGANWPCVRDVDYNPHRANILASCGDDGFLNLWDLRFLSKNYQHTALSGCHNTNFEHALKYQSDSATQPLYSVQSHSHWIWSVRYHPTRDQLIMTAGSDCRVCLYNLSSYSSDALNNGNNFIHDDVPIENNQLDPPRSDGLSMSLNEENCDFERDSLIARLEQHEESVYAAEWSPVDVWYFGSVSYDGNFIITHVPEFVKLNILLQSKDY